MDAMYVNGKSGHPIAALKITAEEHQVTIIVQLLLLLCDTKPKFGSAQEPYANR